MRKIELKDRKIDVNRFIEYGFMNDETNLFFRKHMSSTSFTIVCLLKDNTLECKLIDDDFNEECEIVDGIHALNGYFGKIKEDYEAVIEDMVLKCTSKVKSQRERIIEHVMNEMGDEPEYLWPKFPDDSIIRRKDNKKWYCLFMKLEAKKLGLEGSKTYDVLDLRGNQERIGSIDYEVMFPGYHMNKKHWFTIILDDGMKDSDIVSLVNESYLLAK